MARARVWPAPAVSATQAMQAGPEVSDAPVEGWGASVVDYRDGPGDHSYVPGVDVWVDADMSPITHAGLELGDALRVINPARTPPEGHGGFDIPAAEYGPIINASTRRLAFYISDWIASTAGKGCSGSFDGGHVVIQRIRPGSDQGYQPSQMFSPNQERALPGPWDAALTIGGATLDSVGG